MRSLAGAVGLLALLCSHRAGGEEPPEGRKLDPARLQQQLSFIARLTNNLASAEIDGHRLDMHCGKLAPEAPELERMERLASGVVAFDNASAIKLRTEVDLRFGEILVEAGNIAPDYPGLYSLWLRKLGGGAWRLVFNRQPDVWGTMHDPSADVAEVPLDYERRPEAASELTITVEAEGEEANGVLAVQWGPHRWTAPFSVDG